MEAMVAAEGSTHSGLDSVAARPAEPQLTCAAGATGADAGAPGLVMDGVGDNAKSGPCPGVCGSVSAWYSASSRRRSSASRSPSTLAGPGAATGVSAARAARPMASTSGVDVARPWTGAETGDTPTTRLLEAKAPSERLAVLAGTTVTAVAAVAGKRSAGSTASTWNSYAGGIQTAASAVPTGVALLRVAATRSR